ncbi:MAG: ATP-binding cassette domain-containing protein [Planctomycetia bacterium]|nr:ATP-binding cassette domain-containing protein [Planctomycetia bacterium]
MPLVTLRGVSLSVGGPALLDAVDCVIEPGQRIGLLGRNGAGKTSFLRLLAGQLPADAGEIARPPGSIVALLPQDVPADLHGPVAAIVATGLPAGGDDSAWQRDQAVARILSRMDLDGTAACETLSAGMKRRVLLARALVAEPDLLLLDEPTNHLDIEAIEWLERFLGRWTGTLVFVTHDRAFLRRLATRILEIDRGRVFDWSCDYDTFLARREEAQAAEEKQAALFDKRLAEEEAWIRTGIKARRTRNEGRVRALEGMRRERAARRARPGTVNLRIQEAERSGALVAALEGVAVDRGGRRVLSDVTTTVMRGDRVGIIGRNGVGKSTLLAVLLGRLTPATGRVRLGTNLQVAWFDQLQEQLDPDRSVADNVADGSETVRIAGQPRHVVGYLRDFLFSPERARGLVRFLSGGERNRVLLARLFAKPANLIVLDEPTNDLDQETMELLEERLAEFTGTVLVVSHDRDFLDHVVTSTLVFEPAADRVGGQTVQEYVGGHADWVRQRQAAPPPPPAAGRGRAGDTAPTGPPPPTAARKRRLSFKEQQELAALPALIESLETDLAALHAALAAPEHYRQSRDVIAAEQSRLRELEDRLRTTYSRWESLEASSAGPGREADADREAEPG